MNAPLVHGNPLTVSHSAHHRIAPLLVATTISKTFRGVAALKGVHFELRSGEVHGLVGANGAGKSTLMRILAGAEQPDGGAMLLGGSRFCPTNPREACGAGIAAIYQELSLVPEMSVLSNVFLGHLSRRGPFIDLPATRKRYRELTHWMGNRIPANVRAGSLSIADQQMVEIMRALQARNKVLIMDEPTAPLGPKERLKLYDLISQVAGMGTGIIFISHDLDEVLERCDRISIMRDGQLIDTRAAADWSKDKLVNAMLGEARTSAGTTRSRYGPEIISIQNLAVPGRVTDASFSVKAGEILGIAGLVGSGRTEILRSIGGADRHARGRLSIRGEIIDLPIGIRQAVARGVVLVPEDRKRQGLVLSRSSSANLMLPNLAATSNFGFSRRRWQARIATVLAKSVGLKSSRLKAIAATLSGGNQQKLVIGKWLRTSPSVLLLDEPTRGVDLGAKYEIYQAIRKIADDGAAVILVSSDLEEVVDNADRIIVLARGRLLGSFKEKQATVEGILQMIFGVTGVQSID